MEIKNLFGLTYKKKKRKDNLSFNLLFINNNQDSAISFGRASAQSLNNAGAYNASAPNIPLHMMIVF